MSARDRATRTVVDSPADDAVVERYESIILLGTILPAIGLSFLSFRYLYAIIDDFLLASAISGVVLAVVVFVYVGFSSWKRYGRFPWQRKYFSTLLYSLVGIPLLLVQLVMTVNCALDGAPKSLHEAVIVDKRERHSTRKGRRRDYYYVEVGSWRADLQRISIRVSGANFEELREGDVVVVGTKPGLLGLEWFVESN
jgi:hypothetical protein